MKLAIMQPYLFPYIGYFQLMAAVDHFVIYDDAQWMKGGWINRNRILVEGAPRYFTLPVAKTTHTQRINERCFADDVDIHKKKILRRLAFSDRRAPFFDEILSLVKDCFGEPQRETSLSAAGESCLESCCDYLGIDTPMTMASDVESPTDLAGENKVIHISRDAWGQSLCQPGGRCVSVQWLTVCERRSSAQFSAHSRAEIPTIRRKEVSDHHCPSLMY